MKFKLLLFLIFLTVNVFSQKHNPISWSTTYEKLNDSTFKIILIAEIDKGWHIYSQKQPKEAISIPTKVNFISNPLIKLIGNIKEKGNVEIYKDNVSGIIQNQYENKLELNQIILLKRNVKVDITGNIIYQACTKEMCLPPATTAFSIPLSRN